ncbi:MAG: hypothetical protein WAO58_10670 [Fimbriimonadaceae bacterium]
MRSILLVVVSFVALQSSAQLTPGERKGIEQALYLGNMTVRDLEWARDMRASAHTLPLYRQALTKPLEAADRLLGLHRQGLRSDAPALSLLLRTALFDDPAVPLKVAAAAQWSADGLPAPVRAPVRELIGVVAAANLRIRMALKNLSAEERRLLIEGLPRMAAGENLKLDFAKGPAPDVKAIVTALAKVDLAGIRLAGEDLAVGIGLVLPRLRAAAGKTSYFTGTINERIAGMVVVVAGSGNDTHGDRDASLTIDLGGHDRYRGRHGVGIGASSVLIDVGGNDTYDVGDLSVGAGILGCGLAYDLGGNDTYRGGSVLFGSGLAGVGTLVNEGGDDTYQAASLTQGFGMFGIGLLLDTDGRDRYQAGLLGQGAARSGGAGWLIDRAGDDTYRAGGLVRNPLFKEAFLAQSQGFSAGHEAEGLNGGVGLLSDGAGDDVYLAGTHAQAAALWHGVGSLYDESGHDLYSAHHYAQGCALDSSGAFLFDLAGDDGYMARQGAAQAIGHGNGVAMLLDRAGNDQYSSASARPGSGNAGGLGLFLDVQGDDKYAGAPGFGGLSGMGSVGVFVDLAGQDVYSAVFGEAGAEVRQGWSVSLDLDPPGAESLDSPAPRQHPTPGSKRMPADAEMERLWSGAATDPKLLDELVAIGWPSLKWIAERKLANASGAQTAMVSELVRLVGPDGVQIIIPYAARYAAALEVVIDRKIVEAVAFLPAALAKPELQRLAVRAARLLRAADSAPQLMALVASEDRLLAADALRALAAVGDPQSVGTALAMLGSEDLMVRRAAMGLLALFPPQAIPMARLMIQGDERSARIGLELLGLVGSAEAMKVIGEALADGRSGVKIQAMVELNGRMPPDFQSRADALRNDPNRLVRAIAERMRR